MTNEEKELKTKNKIKCPYEPYLIVTTDCLKNCIDCEIRKKGGFAYSSVIKIN